MENDYRIIKLRAYLFDIIKVLNDKYKQININFLSNDIDNYSLDKIPVKNEVNNWIIGITNNHDIYSFRSRVNYAEDVINNIKNIGFFEEFEQIIKKKNENKDLPEIEGIQSIKCLNCGTMNHADTNTAEFDIQIEIEYIENLDKTIVSL